MSKMEKKSDTREAMEILSSIYGQQINQLVEDVLRLQGENEESKKVLKLSEENETFLINCLTKELKRRTKNCRRLPS